MIFGYVKSHCLSKTVETLNGTLQTLFEAKTKSPQNTAGANIPLEWSVPLHLHIQAMNVTKKQPLISFIFIT